MITKGLLYILGLSAVAITLTVSTQAIDAQLAEVLPPPEPSLASLKKSIYFEESAAREAAMLGILAEETRERVTLAMAAENSAKQIEEAKAGDLAAAREAARAAAYRELLAVERLEVSEEERATLRAVAKSTSVRARLAELEFNEAYIKVSISIDERIVAVAEGTVRAARLRAKLDREREAALVKEKELLILIAEEAEKEASLVAATRS